MVQSGVVPARVVLAVDGNSVLHRAFHAHAASGFRTPDGRPRWAVRGLLSQLVAAADRVQPDAIVVGFDDPQASRRRDQWPQYKATRGDKLPALVEQLAAAAEILAGMGIAVVIPAGLEADDVLASAARLAPTLGARTVIMTSDRDSFALIDEHTSVLRILNGGVENSPLLTPARLRLMLGVDPRQYQDFAALRGDASDNLPGVRGIGPKTAVKLLAALGSARAAFDDLAAGGQRVEAAIGAGAARKLADPAARTAWELNCQVMRMHTDVVVGPEDGRLPLAEQDVRAVFAEYQLPATTRNALALLAHVEDDGAPPRVAWSANPSPSADPSPEVARTTDWRPRRHPPLVPVPASDQLSLF